MLHINLSNQITMKKLLLFTFVAILSLLNSTAQQFDLSAEIRPRYENKHGYKALIAEDTDGSNAISQRSRLNFFYKQEKIAMKVTLQNVRAWGDISTLAASDVNGTALHEAWARVSLSDNISLQMGRQEIVYDDHRIFGSVGWAQQARSHDAFLIKFNPAEGHKVDLGYAMNIDGSTTLVDDVLTLQKSPAGYKNFFYGWYHGDFDKLGVSFLALNVGNEKLETDGKIGVDYTQTVGPRLTYKAGNFNVNAATYYQMGKMNDTDVGALYYALNLGYKVSDNFSLGLGYESLSGESTDDLDEINAFNPIFGTNHKFNGWMDYFYVGNHLYNVGLNDISATLVFKKDKFSAKLIPHFFMTAEDFADGNNLGTEIDLALGYKIAKGISVNAGYSKMFGTESMELLKGGDKDADSSWTWLMFTFKPKLFSTAK